MAKFSYLFLIIWFSSLLKWPLLSWLFASYLPDSKLCFCWLLSWISFITFSMTTLLILKFHPFSLPSLYMKKTNVLAGHVLFKLLANTFFWLLFIYLNVYAVTVEMLCFICSGQASYPFPWFHFWSLSFSPRLKTQGNFGFLSSVPELPILNRKTNNVNSALKHNLYLTLSTRSNALPVV